MKTKVKAFNGVVNTAFSDDEILKESIRYIYLASINTDSA